jgi:hypothetical protein
MPLMARLQPDDSIAQFELAARQRYEEASLLYFGRRPYASIYLYGYAIEMWLKAAYFHNEGVIAQVTDAIGRADRDRAWAQRAAANSPTAPGTNQHNLVAWGYLLIYIRRTAGIHPPYIPLIESTLQNYTATAYDHWNVEMRYQHVDPVLATEVAAVRNVADWFADNYLSL